MDIDTDSSSDDTSGDYTTETSTSSSSSDDDDSMMEIAEIDGEKLQLPQGMCEKKEIFQSILSLDTYKNVLTDENRKYLQQFLPKFPSHNNIDNDKEQTNTIEKLFNYENFYFNNPLEQFYSNLKAGHYRPDIANMKRLILKCELKESKLRYKKYREKLKYDVIESHKKLTEQINNLPPGIELKSERSNDHHYHHHYHRHGNDLIQYRTKRRYYQILSNINSKVNSNNDDYYSPDENYPEGPPVSLSRKQRRHLNSIRNSYSNNHYHHHHNNNNNNSNNGEIFLSTMSTKLTLDLEKYITPQKNPFYITDENYRILLNQHKRRRLDRNLEDPDLNTKNITLTDIINRTQLPYLKNIFVNNNSNKNNHIDNKLVNNTVNNMINNQHNKKKMRKDTSNSDTDSDSSINHSKTKLKLTKPKKIKNDVIKKEIIEVVSPIIPPITTSTTTTTTTPITTITSTILETPIKFELIEQTYANFFSLIRDIICKTPEHRINYKSLEDLIKKWQENPISPLNDWYNLQQNWLKLLKNAINFLCGNNGSRPENFVPYIEYKLNIDMYQWIGAGRDNDNLLQSLFQYWLEHCNNTINSNTSNSNNDDNSCVKRDDSGIVDISDRSQTPPPPRCPTTWTVRKATQDEINNYREQERQRYNNPHKAFTYRCNGYESVVGPLKGIYNNHNIINNTTNNTTNITTKAPRGHTMLTDDRPNFVTILSLVRDATARLPNGEGTRSDICELLKSSQYINNTAPDNVLQSIVSGALDRMHTQLDPCVKYDPKRKIWIYLHRNRTEEDFERIHQQLQSISNKNKKQAVKKSSSNQQHQRKVVKNNEKINKTNNETTTTTISATTTTTTTITTSISTVTTVTNPTITSTASSVGNNTNSLLITNQDVIKTNPDELSINKTKNLVRILSPNLNKSIIIPVTTTSPTTKSTTIIKQTNNIDDNNKGIKTNQFVQSIIPQQIQNVKNVTLIKNSSDINSNNCNNNDKIEQIQIKTPSNLTPAQQQQIIQTIKQKILPQAQIINQQQQPQPQIIFKQKPIVKQQQQQQQPQQQQQQSLLGQAKITEVPKTAVITSQTPVVAKVLTNAAGQVISVESLLAHQKQHGSLPQGTTLRVSKSGHPPNIIQLTSGTGTPKFAVTSQNNLIALTTNTTNQQKLIVASSASLSPSSTTLTVATTTTTSATTTVAITTSTATTTTTVTTTVKTLPRVIGTTTTIAPPRFSAKQLINAKLITTGSGTLTTTPQSRIFVNQQQQQQQQHLKVTPGKNLMLTKPVTLNVATGGNANSITTNPIRMLNATNLNLTHIGGKPVLLASKGNTIQNLQGHNVLLQTQQSSGNNNTNNASVNSGIVLQSSNIKTTLSQQIFSGSQVKLQQPQVVFSSGVKCAVTQQQQSSQQPQQLVLEGHPVRLQTNTSASTQRVVLAASQGQGGQIVAQQILLPAGFQGTAINIKALQGVKVIPLAQAQGRGIPGRPVFARVMNPTIVKPTTTNASITTQDKPPDPVVITTTTGTTTTTD